VRHQRLYCPCYIMISLAKRLFGIPAGVSVASATLVDKFIQIQPVRSIPDILVEHEPKHLLQVSIVAMAEP
jgi:hypothetical protein